MGVDPRTGQSTYNLDELIGFAKLNNFGNKSQAVLQALVQLKYYTTKVIPGLEREIHDLQNPVDITGSTIDEIVIENPPARVGRPAKK